MLRFIYILPRLLLLCGLPFCIACQNNDCDKAESDATLLLKICSSNKHTTTRGIEDLNDNGSVEESELIANGEKMYRLTVYLFSGNKIVSSTTLEADDPRFGNNNTEATVSFANLDYSKSYKLYAVANYGNYGNTAGHIGDINEGNITSGIRVNASQGNICSCATPYPLSLTKDISLTPGANTVSGEMTRTYARLRINVRNQSSTSDLFVTNLSFDPKFTQQSADLFVEGGTANVSPVVTQAEAITPFRPNVMIPKIGDTGSVSETTVFDTYLLESTGGNYIYTLDLMYEGGSEEVFNVGSQAINSLESVEDGEMYVIYSTNAGRYLYANGNSVSAGSSYLSNGELNYNYVWKFNRTTGNRYTIESMGETGYFMQSSQISSNNLPLTVSPGTNDYFTAVAANGYIRLRGNRNSYYIAVNGSTVYGNNSSSSYSQRRYNLYLYKVEKETITSNITHKEEIPIRIIDKISGEAMPITAIKRNDFIDILVNVTYNTKTGEVEFKVSDWENVEGEVTFD